MSADRDAGSDVERRLGAASSDFDRRLGAAGIRGFWSMLGEYEMLEPRNPERPAHWRHAEYSGLAREALVAVPIDKADRRNLFFTNPGLPGSGAITSRLLGGVQAINPGETSSVHRHSAAATRVMLDGDGAHTTVAGGVCRLAFGDVVINPHGLWHESGNDGAEPVLWMDVLDLPFTHMLHANFFASDYTELGPDGVAQPLRNQSVTGIEDWTAHAYGTAGGVRPIDHSGPRSEYGSAQLLYRYGPTRALLDRLRDEPDPHEGSIVEYYDPRRGGPVLRTLGVTIQLLATGRRTLPLRRTAGTIYCCLEGEGRTTVDGLTLDWAEKDIFVVPGWAWREHEATAGDAVLYAVSDAPALHQLGLLYTERRDAGGVVRRRHG